MFCPMQKSIYILHFLCWLRPMLARLTPYQRHIDNLVITLFGKSVTIVCSLTNHGCSSREQGKEEQGKDVVSHCPFVLLVYHFMFWYLLFVDPQTPWNQDHCLNHLVSAPHLHIRDDQFPIPLIFRRKRCSTGWHGSHWGGGSHHEKHMVIPTPWD